MKLIELVVGVVSGSTVWWDSGISLARQRDGGVMNSTVRRKKGVMGRSGGYMIVW